MIAEDLLEHGIGPGFCGYLSRPWHLSGDTGSRGARRPLGARDTGYALLLLMFGGGGATPWPRGRRARRPPGA